MLEERERTYKQGLIERIDSQIGSGERVQVVAVAQVGLPPWVQALPLVVGIVLVVVSVVASLPGWVGIAGALLVLVGIGVLSVVSRRLVARTNRNLYVFDLPRSQKAEIGGPKSVTSVGELPAMNGGSVRLGGERLWANYGSGLERDALAEVLAPKS